MTGDRTRREWLPHGHAIDRAFAIGIIAKGPHGLAEILGGLSLRGNQVRIDHRRDACRPH